MVSALELKRFGEIVFPVEAVLSGPRLRISELIALHAGSVVRIGAPTGSNLTVTAGGSPIAAAELTVLDDHRVLRIVAIGATR